MKHTIIDSNVLAIATGATRPRFSNPEEDQKFTAVCLGMLKRALGSFLPTQIQLDELQGELKRVEHDSAIQPVHKLRYRNLINSQFSGEGVQILQIPPEEIRQYQEDFKRDLPLIMQSANKAAKERNARENAHREFFGRQVSNYSSGSRFEAKNITADGGHMPSLQNDYLYYRIAQRTGSSLISADGDILAIHTALRGQREYALPDTDFAFAPDYKDSTIKGTQQELSQAIAAKRAKVSARLDAELAKPSMQTSLEAVPPVAPQR